MLTITNVNRPELTIALEPKRFPGGETHPLVDPAVASWPHIRLTAVLKNGDDVMELLLTLFGVIIVSAAHWLNLRAAH